MIKAKKKYGQNFLKDSTVLHKIVQSMSSDTKQIVEIGPGLGDLTRLLVKEKEVVAYEVDKDLCSILKRTFSTELQEKKLRLSCGDVLNVWEEHKTLLPQPYEMVANLPYYIATNIILQALEDENCTSILVMVQKEVAEKFCAKSGEKAFSSLSVITDTQANSELLFDVPSTAFEPQPKVVSAVMKIEKIKDKTIDKNFNAFLRQAFTAPRKTLMKNLSSHYSKEVLRQVFEENNIPQTYRAHQLETASFHLLYQAVTQ